MINAEIKDAQTDATPDDDSDENDQAQMMLKALAMQKVQGNPSASALTGRHINTAPSPGNYSNVNMNSPQMPMGPNRSQLMNMMGTSNGSGNIPGPARTTPMTPTMPVNPQTPMANQYNGPAAMHQTSGMGSAVGNPMRQPTPQQNQMPMPMPQTAPPAQPLMQPGAPQMNAGMMQQPNPDEQQQNFPQLQGMLGQQ